LCGRITSEDEEITEFSCGGTSCDRNTFADSVFAPGEYLILVQVIWKQKANHFFSVSTYGETLPSLSEVDRQNYPIQDLVVDYFLPIFGSP